MQTVLYPKDAWNKIVKYSTEKSYLATHNWILERLFKPRQLERLGTYEYNYEKFTHIVENSLESGNLKFLERFLKSSEETFNANEDTIRLYFTCSKVVERHRNNKNEIQIERILHILFNSNFNISIFIYLL